MEIRSNRRNFLVLVVVDVTFFDYLVEAIYASEIAIASSLQAVSELSRSKKFVALKNIDRLAITETRRPATNSSIVEEIF